MAIATMNISLPEQLREFVEKLVTEGGYGSASEYFRELVREDKKRREQEKLERLLLEGIESGPPIKVTKEFWQNLRAELVERYNTKKGAAKKTS